MSEEEKKAIEILTSWYNYNKKNRNKLLEADKIIKVQKTILNLIEKQEKELNNLKEIEQQHKTDNGLLRQELDMQIEHNKEIDDILYAKQSMIDELTQNEEKLKIELGKVRVRASAQILNESIKNNKVTNEQLEALNEGWKLENEKLKADLYEANNIISDYIDTTAKQEKMIEMMAEFIDIELSSEHLSRVLEKEVSPLETYRKDIKQYFEKKAEESE